MNSPLEIYKEKMNSKNWSEFANNKMKRNAQKSSVTIQDDIYFNEIFPAKTSRGINLELSKPKIYNGNMISREISKTINLINVKMEDNLEKNDKIITENIKNNHKLKISMNQLELLESVGTFIKQRDSYYPSELEEIEYLIKMENQIIYDNL